MKRTSEHTLECDAVFASEDYELPVHDNTDWKVSAHERQIAHERLAYERIMRRSARIPELATAILYAQYTPEVTIIVLGEPGEYLVMSLSDAAWMQRRGYEVLRPCDYRM